MSFAAGGVETTVSGKFCRNGGKNALPFDHMTLLESLHDAIMDG
jgi:hypothetical protein